MYIYKDLIDIHLYIMYMKLWQTQGESANSKSVALGALPFEIDSEVLDSLAHIQSMHIYTHFIYILTKLYIYKLIKFVHYIYLIYVHNVLYIHNLCT